MPEPQRTQVVVEGRKLSLSSLDKTLYPATEIVVPEEFKAAGKFLPTCSPKAQEYYTAIWTELQK